MERRKREVHCFAAFDEKVSAWCVEFLITFLSFQCLKEKHSIEKNKMSNSKFSVKRVPVVLHFETYAGWELVDDENYSLCDNPDEINPPLCDNPIVEWCV